MALTVTATFRTKPELKSRIELLAKATRRSTSFYYNLLLEEYHDDLEDIDLSEQILPTSEAGNKRLFRQKKFLLRQDYDSRIGGKVLGGNFTGMWRYRVGDYRLICEIANDKILINNLFFAKPL